MSRHPVFRSCARLFLGPVLEVAAASAMAAVPGGVDIDQGWSFRLVPGNAQVSAHPEAEPWRSATVPGAVHVDLLAHKLIPDPYVGAAEAGLQWIGLADWEYRTSFDAPHGTLERARSDLVFEGLDIFAEVWLNGDKLLDADNAFRTWRVPVQGRLRAKGNELRIVLRSPITKLLPQVQAMPHKLAGNFTSPYGDEPKDAMTANFARKPGYHYGWDWGPRYVTAGIWKPVMLQSWDAVRVADLQLRQDHVDETRADVVAVVSADVVRGGEFDLRLWQTTPDGGRSLAAHRRVELKAGGNRVELPVRIDHPQRWFPTGYGAQPLYHFDLEVGDGKATLATKAVRTGLRSVELRLDRDDKGRAFHFVVNGIPVFAKGANAIPFDSFQPRVTRAQLRRVLESARDANMNMVRNWGGGYYESDDFFDIADELGLLVWQDFMFGGGMPPAYDDAFRANVVAEARDNVRRLRNHPSLVLWCGNNEEEIAWKYWGPGKALLEADPAFGAKVWQGYVQLFGTDLREVVAEEGGGIGYWSSSPGDDLAEVANTPASGDMHYWEVWGNPAYPATKYLEITPRFMSEYGLQAWPVQATVDAVIPRDQQQVDGPVVRAHQKFLAGDGNQRLLHYIRMDYREPVDFGDFIYLSQVMQAAGIELAASHHRASRPYTMGTLYWQLNDVWPGTSWSSIDYLGRWKALHFHARRFFAPLAVVASHAGGSSRVSVVSDLTHGVHGTLALRLMDFDGKLLDRRVVQADVPALSARELLRLDDADLLKGHPAETTFAVLEWCLEGLPSVRTELYFAPPVRQSLPDPGLRATIESDAQGPWLRLHAERLARAVWLDFPGHDEVELEDNAFDLLPGEERTIRLKSGASPATLAAALRVRTLDRPGAHAVPALKATR